MNQKHFFLLLSVAVLLAACSNNAESSSNASVDTAKESVAEAPTATAPTATTTVSTNDPAIAVIENEKIRFKLHALHEVVPDAAAPSKANAGKKIYAADISAEYLMAHEKSPAEYMLSAYLLDEKGNKFSLPLGSTRLALTVSESQAQEDNVNGAAFNQSNPPAGQKFRGRHYGVEMDAAAKPAKWGMVLDGKTIEVDIK